MQRDLMSADIGMSHDDAIAGANGGGSGGGGGMNIGNAAPVQNLDHRNGYSQMNPRDKENFELSTDDKGRETYTPKEPEPKPEPEPQATQGQHEQNIDYYQRQIEKWNDLLNKDDLKNWHSFMGKLTKEEIALLEKYANENDMPIGKVKANSPEAKALMTNFINHMISNYKNDIYRIKTETDYDNRSDTERRADTATQRAAADYIAAGLNPKALSGFTGGGGGGGGSSGSKSDEEEEKRKKRRKEIEEIRRAKHAEQMRQKELVTGIVKSLTDTGVKAVGGAAFMGHQKAMAQTNQAHQKAMQTSANTHNRYMIEAEKLAGNKKYRLEDQVGYYDENGKWHNIKLKDIRE